MINERLDEQDRALDAALRNAARANPALRDELLREWVAEERELCAQKILGISQKGD